MANELKIRYGTLIEYNNLSTKDNDTLYFTEEGFLFKGSIMMHGPSGAEVIHATMSSDTGNYTGTTKDRVLYNGKLVYFILGQYYNKSSTTNVTLKLTLATGTDTTVIPVQRFSNNSYVDLKNEYGNQILILTYVSSENVWKVINSYSTSPVTFVEYT